MKYRELKIGETWQRGDQFKTPFDIHMGYDWHDLESFNYIIKKEDIKAGFKYRRPIKNNHPSTNLFE